MTDLEKLNAECERAWSAYRIAHNQAMSNGEVAANARAEVEALLERVGVLEKEHAALKHDLERVMERENDLLNWACLLTNRRASLTQGGE